MTDPDQKVVQCNFENLGPDQAQQNFEILGPIRFSEIHGPNQNGKNKILGLYDPRKFQNLELDSEFFNKKSFSALKNSFHNDKGENADFEVLNVVRFNKSSQFSHACKLCLIYSVITKDFRRSSY